MSKPSKPVIHSRDHEYGGADPVGIVWELDDSSEGFNDATFDAVFTNHGTGVNTGAGTFTNGTTPGSWLALDGAQMQCQLAGDWTVELTGTLTHTGATETTFVALDLGGTDLATLHSASMANGDTAALSYSDTITVPDGGSIQLRASHSGFSSTVSSTITGTIAFTPA